MKRRTPAWYVIAALSVFAATTALAHGTDGVHLMGLVTTVDATSLSLETKDGKPVTVRLGEETRFERSGRRTTVSELQVGERVVVHAKKAGSGLQAQLVKFGKKPQHGGSNGGGEAGTSGSRQPHGAH